MVFAIPFLHTNNLSGDWKLFEDSEVEALAHAIVDRNYTKIKSLIRDDGLDPNFLRRYLWPNPTYGVYQL